MPLFISGPERYVGKRGTVRTDLAELRDVMPTLLELAGAPIPETVDGTSLLHPVEREYLHGEHTLGEDSMHFILTKRINTSGTPRPGGSCTLICAMTRTRTKMHWTKTQSA